MYVPPLVLLLAIAVLPLLTHWYRRKGFKEGVAAEVERMAYLRRLDREDNARQLED